jgi:hypothetical protein
MTEEGTPPQPDGPLQFDRVETDQPQGAAPPSEGLACKACGTAIRREYFSWNGAPLCETCKATLETARQAANTWSTFGRAVVFGIGATIAGAVLYYGVIAITKLEIGLVAIAIGYMVGYSVRRGSRGWGGRRYQVLALLLTYYSVGLAYFPLAMQEGRKTTEQERQAASDAKPKETPEAAAEPTRSDAFLALGVMLLFCFALPVVAVVGSLPSGLITAFIIFIGMRQAWRMTAALPIEVTGPYKLGAHPAIS